MQFKSLLPALALAVFAAVAALSVTTGTAPFEFADWSGQVSASPSQLVDLRPNWSPYEA
ncbi:MAG: hypothetical protein AAFY02_15475 [Pseudomonadota bacterium]